MQCGWSATFRPETAHSHLDIYHDGLGNYRNEFDIIVLFIITPHFIAIMSVSDTRIIWDVLIQPHELGKNIKSILLSFEITMKF